MSIWNDIQKYGGQSYYGFPLIITIVEDSVVFEFPKGYTPNGNQIKKVANHFMKAIGKEKDNKIIFNEDKKKFSFKYDKNVIENIIHDYLLNFEGV